MKKNTIVLVGGGANGVASFIHLVIKLIIHKKPGLVNLVLLEKEEEIGPGLAYGTRQKGHLLNTQAKLMGIFAEEPLHFVHWCRQNQPIIQEHFPGLEIQENSFPPRELYGFYLKAVLQEYVQIARANKIQVELQQDEAVDADIVGNRINLHLQSGTNLLADVVVLATGTPKPNNFPHLKNSPRYFDFPWPAKPLLERIPRNEPVSILGSSLTAIDTVMTFVDNGHTGPLTMYSHHGLIPRVQTPFEVPYERKILTMENIRQIMREQQRPIRAKDLFRLFIAEAEQVMGKQGSWKKFNRTDQPHQELLQHDIAVAEKGTSVFQNIAYSTRHLSSKVWQLLPENEKIKFLEWLGPHWDLNRFSMPPENARKLLGLLQTRQLTIQGHSGKIEWQAAEQQFLLHLESGETHTARWLVNATGTAKKLEKMEIPLLQQMHRKSLIQPFKPGGIQANPHNLRIPIPHHPAVLLYGTGQLLNGELLDTNSVWFNVTGIDRLTNDIITRLLHGSTE
ncbi:FAD/NAD(P)-binding protein [Adhaeribacter swui]|uniref:FAD/NAD(P)-binding protein n=1 Tax=Adhaeribacter swui TaxID=2086471 RepID=A0A7G7GC00_9BACT|nr:FAD/NAD(P)-binding protein [Adhaeribacter swui]QNF34684.1 FAD/NAD(P)-binding protein [Adhaeribacter swui]